MYSCDFEATANAFGSCDAVSRRQVCACQQSGHQGAPSARSARRFGFSRNRGNNYGNGDVDNNIDGGDHNNDDDNGNIDGDNVDGDVKRNGSRDNENGQARGNNGVQRGSIAVDRAHAPVPGEQLRASP